MAADSNKRSEVNLAASATRLASNPPRVPDSRLWYSDREIGSRRSKAAHEFSAQDYRNELARVERRIYRVLFAAIAFAILASVAIVLFVLL